MTSVVERLIESWLDSQTERRYQPAFIQLLVSEGWTVLHNTRHSPIELGKDVIARDPAGVLHCFQLKGNPGTRVTKSEAQTLLPQVIELIELAPSDFYRTSFDERHVAVFVTNGTIDEEAEVVFAKAAARTAKETCAASSFELLGRGELLARFVKAAGQVWPTTVEGTRQLLNLMAQDGRSLPDAKVIAEVLVATAPLPAAGASQPERSAHLNAMLLVAEIAKAPWYAASNHYALYLITVLAAMHGLRFADQPARATAVAHYASLALEHAHDLLTEARAVGFNPAKVWSEQDTLSEFDIMWERGRLIGDVAATLLLAEATTDGGERRYAADVVRKTFEAPMFWGFAPVPAYIVRWWAMARIDPTRGPDRMFAQALGAIIDASLGRAGREPLAGPYYGFVDVWAWMNEIRYVGDDGIFDDNFSRRAWFTRAMLQMIAKRNWKQTSKSLWPPYSRVVHEEPDLPAAMFFDARLVRGEGRLRSYTYQRKEWVELIAEAVDETEGAFLEPHRDLAWLIAAYVALVPYRAWTGVLMWLDHRLNQTWYAPGRVAV
ncbi:MAG: hypothetical protein GC145_07930 [Caulobacter sp.]|nr:hypothetical protein [Caulobacter sp.]